MSFCFVVTGLCLMESPCD